MRRILLLACVLLTPFPVVGQAQSAASTASDSWTVPRTPDGQPDLQGVWDYRTLTPLERPSELTGKETFTDDEAARFQQEALANRNADRRDGATTPFGFGSDVERAYNDFWWDYGKTLTEDKRTSLIVDPPDGRVPYTPEARERATARFATFFGSVPAGPEDRSLWERCLTLGVPRLSGAYNNNYQIVQTAGYVAILAEMIHETRIIPLGDRPHIPLGDRPHIGSAIRQWLGDSRGRWEGDTLVIDTTNFSDKTNFSEARENLHLVERFTRVDEDTLLYEVTVDDPTAFERPWTFVLPATKNESRIYEYACHEGNYGMVNLLAGARAEDKVAASQKD